MGTKTFLQTSSAAVLHMVNGELITVLKPSFSTNREKAHKNVIAVY